MFRGAHLSPDVKAHDWCWERHRQSLNRSGVPCKDLGAGSLLPRLILPTLLSRRIDSIPIITCQLALDVGLHSLCPALPGGIQEISSYAEMSKTSG